MRIVRGLMIAILAGLLFTDASADSARAQLERFSEGLESLHADFSQLVVS